MKDGEETQSSNQKKKFHLAKPTQFILTSVISLGVGAGGMFA